MQYFLVFWSNVYETIETIAVFCLLKSMCTWPTTENYFEMVIVTDTINIMEVKLAHMFWHILESKAQV